MPTALEPEVFRLDMIDMQVLRLALLAFASVHDDASGDVKSRVQSLSKLLTRALGETGVIRADRPWGVIHADCPRAETILGMCAYCAQPYDMTVRRWYDGYCSVSCVYADMRDRRETSDADRL